MVEDSKVNLKMLFEILTDKEVEELKERAVRSGISTLQICCGGRRRSDPTRRRSQFSRRLCGAKTPASCWAGAAFLNGANAPVG
jgi:hypothetical protein